MTGSSRYTRAISHEVEDIERRLRRLQRGSERQGKGASSNARDAAEGLSEALGSALSNWADRFRDGAYSLGERSATFGKDSAPYGTAALDRVSSETEQRPLIAVAVAFGDGVLVGMAMHCRG